MDLPGNLLHFQILSYYFYLYFHKMQTLWLLWLTWASWNITRPSPITHTQNYRMSTADITWLTLITHNCSITASSSIEDCYIGMWWIRQRRALWSWKGNEWFKMYDDIALFLGKNIFIWVMHEIKFTAANLSKLGVSPSAHQQDRTLFLLVDQMEKQNPRSTGT